MVIGPLCGVFARIFRVVSNKESSISDYYEERDGCVVWRVPFRRSLHLSGVVHYEELLTILSNAFLCRKSKDSWN